MKASQKYKEIFKLKKMLEEANIPFDFIEGCGYPKEYKKLYPDILERYQICYPSNENRWISVIEGFGSHGEEKDRLEIMGGLTPFEKYRGDEPIKGYLTANNVFKRIKTHYELNLFLNNKED